MLNILYQMLLFFFLFINMGPKGSENATPPTNHFQIISSFSRISTSILVLTKELFLDIEILSIKV